MSGVSLESGTAPAIVDQGIANAAGPVYARRMISTALAITGVLVTYARGNEIGRERYSDDGKVLRSEISLGPQKATITITRSSRQVVVEAAGKTITREAPAGVLALENGHWQAYALVAEQ